MTRADSESTNPDPMQNDRINIHKTKTITGSKLRNTIEKSEYATKYVFQERGVTPVMAIIVDGRQFSQLRLNMSSG